MLIFAWLFKRRKKINVIFSCHLSRAVTILDTAHNPNCTNYVPTYYVFVQKVLTTKYYPLREYLVLLQNPYFYEDKWYMYILNANTRTCCNLYRKRFTHLLSLMIWCGAYLLLSFFYTDSKFQFHFLNNS